LQANDGLEVSNHSVQFCRLCGGEADKQFYLKVLGRHEVGYWRCRDCGSLQTSEPYWLAEAYSNSLAVSDTGAVRRCLINRAVIWLVLRLLRVHQPRLLDFGGGSGLLCRLLRDIGFDAWTCDPHGSGEYSQLFRIDMGAIGPGLFAVISAFEVFEHMPRPDEELAMLYSRSPEVLIASTEPYSANFDKTWWYLSPQTGQHVFFYSQRALQLIADRFGYSLQSIGGWHIFTRQPITPITRKVLWRVLSGRPLQLCRVLLEAMPSEAYIMRDHRLSLEKVRSAKA
jgi:hypothetical protein